ncbi:hypothetical protein VP01_4828g3 [Puccinia sorghi]|uniref:Uncharacterized protein n=1 Tax=Puccinia sorghi TaxID=27349 RepID=A0A0L6UMI2_9BASI|nr:hypothetical protein VP01_4828g3 [Puccinia sorghi]
MIASLAKEVHSLKSTSNPPPNKAKKKPVAAKNSTPKQTTSQAQKSPQKIQHSQPKTTTRSQNLNQGILKVFKAPSTQHHPKQMTTGDFPPEFTSTKVNSLQSFPVLKSVYSFCFLECTVCSHQYFVGPFNTRCTAWQTQSPLLINTNEVQLFKKSQAGSIKFRRKRIHFHFKQNLLNCQQLTCSMLQPSCHPNSTFLNIEVGVTTEASREFLHVNCRQLSICVFAVLGSDNIHYAKGLMVCLGLHVWCPNLEEDLVLLYNATVELI